MKHRPIYLKDIVGLYNYDRIRISEGNDKRYTLLSGTIAVDMMGDMQVESISVQDNALCVYLHNNSISGYWDNKGDKNDDDKSAHD